MKDHIILSEKPEDLRRAADWGKEQKEKQKRNNAIGEKMWKRIFPIITGAENRFAK